MFDRISFPNYFQLIHTLMKEKSSPRLKLEVGRWVVVEGNRSPHTTLPVGERGRVVALCWETQTVTLEAGRVAMCDLREIGDPNQIEVGDLVRVVKSEGMFADCERVGEWGVVNSIENFADIEEVVEVIFPSAEVCGFAPQDLVKI